MSFGNDNTVHWSLPTKITLHPQDPHTLALYNPIHPPSVQNQTSL